MARHSPQASVSSAFILSLFSRHLRAKRFLLLSFCIAIGNNVYATKADVETELEQYVSAYQTLDVTAKVTSEKLMYAGINDPTLYQLIFDTMQANKEASGKEVQALAWFAYSLAYSGDEKWIKKIEELRPQLTSGQLRGYYKKAIKKIEKYRGVPELIAAGGEQADSNRLRQHKLKNMFNSDNPDLIEAAGKEIQRKYFLDRGLITEVGKRLEQLASLPSNDKRASAGTALAKAVGGSLSRDQLAVLGNVKANAKNSKLRSAAGSAQKKLQKFANIKPNGLGSITLYVDAAWASGGGFSKTDSMFYADYFTQGLQRELALKGYDIKHLVVGSVGADPLFFKMDTAEKQVYSIPSHRGGDKRKTPVTMPIFVSPALGKNASDELLTLYRNLSAGKAVELPTGFTEMYPSDNYVFASVVGNHVSMGAKFASSAVSLLVTAGNFIRFPIGFTEAEMSVVSPTGELLGRTAASRMGGADHGTFLYVGRKLGKQIDLTIMR